MRIRSSLSTRGRLRCQAAIANDGRRYSSRSVGRDARLRPEGKASRGPRQPAGDRGAVAEAVRGGPGVRAHLERTAGQGGEEARSACLGPSGPARPYGRRTPERQRASPGSHRVAGASRGAEHLRARASRVVARGSPTQLGRAGTTPAQRARSSTIRPGLLRWKALKPVRRRTPTPNETTPSKSPASFTCRSIGNREVRTIGVPVAARSTRVAWKTTCRNARPASVAI